MSEKVRYTNQNGEAINCVEVTDNGKLVIGCNVTARDTDKLVSEFEVEYEGCDIKVVKLYV